MADLSEALKTFDFDALLKAAEDSDPLLGVESARCAESGIAALTTLESTVRNAQDATEAINAILAVQGNAGALLACGYALARRKAETLTLLGHIRKRPKVGKTVDTFARLMEGEAERVREKGEDAEQRFRSRVLDAILKPLGVSGLKCPPGYEIDSDGIRTDDELVSSAPVVITGIARYALTGRLRVDVAWCLQGKWTKRQVDRSVIAETGTLIKALSDEGLPVTAVNAFNLVRYLSAFEAHNLNKLPVYTVSQHMGWVGDGLLIGNECIGDKVVLVEDKGFGAGYRTAGSWDGWCDVVRKHVAKRPLAMLGIYASCAAPLLRVLDEQGFIVDWSGDTSQGKTTTLQCGASVWGYPTDAQQDGIILKWSSASMSSIADAAWFAQNLPLLIDETKQVEDPKIASAALYMLPSGREKSRSNVDGKRREPRAWRTVLLSTGESPITSFGRKHGGAIARTICVSGSPFASKDEVVAVSDGLKANHGWLGRRLAEVLVDRSRWPALRSRFETLRDEYSRGKGAVEGRVSTYLAVIAVAAELCVELGVPGDPGPALKAAGASIADIAQAGDLPTQALADLHRWAWANEESFWQRTLATSPRTEWFGRWDPCESGCETYQYIAFDPKIAARKLEEWGYTASDIFPAWERRGWVLKDPKGGNPKVGKGGTRLIAVAKAALDAA